MTNSNKTRFIVTKGQIFMFFHLFNSDYVASKVSYNKIHEHNFIEIDNKI